MQRVAQTSGWLNPLEDILQQADELVIKRVRCDGVSIRLVADGLFYSLR